MYIKKYTVFCQFICYFSTTHFRMNCINFVIACWDHLLCQNCVMYLVGLLNMLIGLDWYLMRVCLHWTDVTDAFHNMWLYKFNDRRYSVFCGWQCWLAQSLDHSVMYWLTLLLEVYSTCMHIPKTVPYSFFLIIINDSGYITLIDFIKLVVYMEGHKIYIMKGVPYEKSIQLIHTL